MQRFDLEPLPLASQSMTDREAKVNVTPLFRNVDEARRCLRVEIDADQLHEIYRGNLSLRPHERGEGPHMIEGVAYYVIEHPRALPAPGWRVINPFDKPR